MASAVPGDAKQGFMGRLSGILFRPSSEWPAIAAEPRSYGDLLLRWVAPLSLISALAALFRSLVFGDPFLDQIVIRPPSYLIPVAIIDWGAMILVTMALGGVIAALAPVFGGRRDAVAALKIAGYGLTPWYLSELSAAVPISDLLPFMAAMPVLLLVGLLGLYSFYVIYAGLTPVAGVLRDRAPVMVAALLVVAIALVVVRIYVADALIDAMFQPLPVGTRVFAP